ncbi:chorismate mutase [Qipengyuania sp.]|uniref:chorismate mutase n=1 Tax=Qipengyuania sp. TaxID=2004515 RepID=UPI0035C85668
MSDFLLPTKCKTMVDVRLGVDATDRELLALLERRFDYMRAAARIKQNRSEVRDEIRKSEVIGNAVREASRRGLPADALGAIWNALVEASIAFELEEWDRVQE